jgi:tetratricopeptide (TPR) repeat protein
MKENKYFKKNYNELLIEAILRSIIFGLSAGFAVGFIVFIVGIITTSNLLLIGIILSTTASLIVGVIKYIYGYRPTNKKVAQRIDELGLEERTITMVELEQSGSYIAQVQREDTKKKLEIFTPKLLSFQIFVKPLIMLVIVMSLMGVSLGFMVTRINASNEPNDQTDLGKLPEDIRLEQMIEDLLSIINNANVDVTLKNTLYGMVIDLSDRLPTYDTYLEKYADVLKTRNEILLLIAEAIIELEDSVMNIAEALQKYENTEGLGAAIATWDDDIIIAAFNQMYERIDVLLGQELYDVMWQTALDIEAALAEAVGTYPAMHDALQSLADAYKLALIDFEIGNEEEVLDNIEQGIQESLEEFLAALQEIRELIEALLELEEDIEDAIDDVDQFPLFIPFPEDGAGDEPGEPNNQQENTVIDGQTPYKDVYDSYYDDAMAWLSEENISEDMRRIIENYFKMLS